MFIQNIYNKIVLKRFGCGRNMLHNSDFSESSESHKSSEYIIKVSECMYFFFFLIIDNPPGRVFS